MSKLFILHSRYDHFVLIFLVGCFGCSGPLRQYCSLQEGETEKIEDSKMSKQPPPAPTANAIGPCPTIIQIVGRPGTLGFESI